MTCCSEVRKMGVQFSKCYVCKHFISGGELENFKCKAFPDGIPAKIVFGETNHNIPIEGDHGYRYENIFDETPAEEHTKQ